MTRKAGTQKEQTKVDQLNQVGNPTAPGILVCPVDPAEAGDYPAGKILIQEQSITPGGRNV